MQVTLLITECKPQQPLLVKEIGLISHDKLSLLGGKPRNLGKEILEAQKAIDLEPQILFPRKMKGLLLLLLQPLKLLLAKLIRDFHLHINLK
jgi:hypothetical protein